MSLQTKSAIKVILLTGVRTAELRLATIGEFDMDNSLWKIPAEHCKGGETLKIHLSDQVKNIISMLSKECDNGHVIYGESPHQPLSENAISRAIARIQERIGIPKWTAHDLRRTFATHLGETLRIDPVVIEKCLGHKMPRIMATYNKNEMLHERKEALIRWSHHITSYISSNNITPLLKVV